MGVDSESFWVGTDSEPWVGADSESFWVGADSETF